jgi:hypothetical protein
VLCKASASIRDAYEIRLALFFAVHASKKFVLAVPPGAQVDSLLMSHIALHGGIVREDTIVEYSVYVGHVSASGQEGDGWVMGDSSSHASLLHSLRSDWLKEKLVPGAMVAAAEMRQLELALQNENISLRNIDDENIKAALSNLQKTAMKDGGYIFVQ